MGEKLVIDLETQKEFAEVEGRKPELLLVSVAGVYSYEANRYDAYLEADLATKLGPRLQQAELIIGFNSRRFDMVVLQPYLPFPVDPLPQLDILEDIVKALGHRVSLESVAQATLGRGKTGHGLEALKWFKEGRFDLITKYCLDDVKLTKEVYEYGRQHHRLFATDRGGTDKLNIPVFWPDRKRDLNSITKTIIEACSKQLQVEIEYTSPQKEIGETAQSTRRVDIYYVKDAYFEGYCHLRKDIRQFKIERVVDIKPTWQRYSVPAGFVPTISG